jgi:hypothetical protein
MERRRILRSLRTAATVACVAACYLLVLLCVRSYWWRDRAWIIGFNNVLTQLSSDQGSLSLERRSYHSHSDSTGWWQIWSYQIGTGASQMRRSSILATRYEWRWHPDSIAITVPHWVLILASGALAAPWLCHAWKRQPYRIRFSTRTLLIVTGFVAVFLGLIAAATQ